MARETSSVVDGKLQQQLAMAQERLLAEQQRRVDAEGEARVQQAKAEQEWREVERLQRTLAARDSLIQQLRTARLNDTPAREVGAGEGRCCMWRSVTAAAGRLAQLQYSI